MIHILMLAALLAQSERPIVTKENYIAQFATDGTSKRPFSCTQKFMADSSISPWICEVRDLDDRLMATNEDGKITYYNGETRKTVKRWLRFLRFAAWSTVRHLGAVT